MAPWNEPQRNALVRGGKAFTTPQRWPLQVSEPTIGLHMHLKMCLRDMYKELAH